MYEPTPIGNQLYNNDNRIKKNSSENNQLPIKQQGIPDIYFTPGNSPIISTSNSPFILQFKQTRESFLDVDLYKRFLDNAIYRFRTSRTYKSYKRYLINLGMNRCQVHGNITSEMATIEMHHNMLTIFDIAFIITEHILNTHPEGITTFDLVMLLGKAHKENKVQLVMLSKTPHQLYHNTDQLHLPPSMCFGDWFSFLQEYNMGITKEIAYKILFYLRDFEDDDFGNNYDILKIRDEIIKWGKLDEKVQNYIPQPSAFDMSYYNYDPVISNQLPQYIGMNNVVIY